jgi:Putative DNA-binding domain
MQLSDWQRFAVYRNNVVAGLIDALRETFPVTLRIVGADFFAAMARVYVTLDPPRSPILLEYGSGFANFIEKFEPASSLPYLSDVCRIERVWLEAYHAPEAVPVELSQLEAVPPSEIPVLQLGLHPSVRLVRSKYPALTIWKTNIDGGIPVPVDLQAGSEDVLISRPHADVEIRSISRSAFAFVQAIANQSTILRAAEIALDSDPKFLLSNALAVLFRAGLIVNYHTAANYSTTNRNRGQR